MAEGGVGVLPALRKGEKLPGEHKQVWGFLAAVLSRQSPVPAAVGTEQWSMTSLCAPKASSPAIWSCQNCCLPTLGSVCAPAGQRGQRWLQCLCLLISAGVINAAHGARAQSAHMSQRGHPENPWLSVESEGNLGLPK